MTDAAPVNLLADAAESAPTTSAGAQTGGCGGHCTCGQASDEAPELDVRTIPAPIRHAAILGALGSIAPGASLILLAPHEPVPLLAQLDASEPGVWTSKLEQAGPDVWRVRVTRAL